MTTLHQGVITPSQVSRRAAPALTAWCLDQSGAHGVELDVPRRGQEVVFIHDERGEAALPQVPSPPFPEVDPPRVPPMCLADGATQALGGLRDNDQVNMVGYQAICSDRDLLCAAESRHELEVVQVVFFTDFRGGVTCLARTQLFRPTGRFSMAFPVSAISGASPHKQVPRTFRILCAVFPPPSF